MILNKNHQKRCAWFDGSGTSTPSSCPSAPTPWTRRTPRDASFYFVWKPAASRAVRASSSSATASRGSVYPPVFI